MYIKIQFHNFFYLIAFPLGLVAQFAFAPTYYFLYAFISFSGFFALLRICPSRKQLLFLSFCYFMGYFLGFSALTEHTSITLAIIATAFYLATLYTLVIGLSMAMTQKQSTTWQLLLFTLLWSFAEWLRGHLFTGMPWNLISNIWLFNHELSQANALFGAYGFNVFTIFILIVPALFILRPKLRTTWLCIVSAVLIFISLYAYGYYRLSQAIVEYWPNTSIRIIQTNFDEQDHAVNQTKVLLDRHLKQSLDNLPNDTRAILWPEAALNHYYVSNTDKALKRYNKFIAKIAEHLPPHISLIAGLKRVEIKDTQPPEIIRQWHGLAVIDTDGHVLGFHDKYQLIPFTEYMPFASLTGLPTLLNYLKQDSLNLDYTHGKGPSLLSAPKLPSFSPVICYESLFPGEIVNSQLTKPSWLVVVSNDYWYRNTKYPYLLSEMTRVRAIEEGLPLIRVVNSGISSVVDAYGRYLKTLPIYTFDNYDTLIPKSLAGQTLYGWLGDTILFVLLTLLAINLYIGYQKPARQSKNSPFTLNSR